METLDELDQDHAASVSNEALRLMNELGVPVIPTNFIVWFTYVLGRSPALRKTIDILRSNNRRFDKSVNRELYSTFLKTSRPSATELTISEELNAILLDVRNDLSGAAADNRMRAQRLTGVSQALRGTDPQAALARLAEELAKATERASGLEARLADASNEVEQLRAELEKSEVRSRTDVLTGLANRRALEAFLRTAQIKAMEDGGPLSVFLADIDHFKRFNDKYGHQLGDQVLRVVAKYLNDGIRQSDFAARYGGEELMCVLPGAALNACRDVADKIRARIANAQVTKRATGESIGQVTISIGVAEFVPGESFETLFERCDGALYRAKQAGRNRPVAVN
jgi:diguanylate cyclase